MENRYGISIRGAKNAQQFYDDLLTATEKRWGHDLGLQPSREPDTLVRITHASIWNNPGDVGNKYKIVATNGRFCILAMPPELGLRRTIYRHEDVTPL